MRREIIGKQFDEERALYNLRSTNVLDCVFAGPADGESALNASRDVKLENCTFSLRYPLWHVEKFHLHDSKMDDNTRAPIWYCRDGMITDSDIHGAKAVRECENIKISDCTITSDEFGWKSKGLTVTDSTLDAQYLFLDSKDVKLDKVEMNGQNSFQYTENVTVSNSILDTKDAFWHSKNVTVTNCLVKGEHLGWFSDGLTMENCRIIGTQPLCHCKNLTLKNCVMEEADLAFEYSDVNATIIGHVDSIRNPRSGEIAADSVGEVIMGNAVMECTGKVTVR